MQVIARNYLGLIGVAAIGVLLLLHYGSQREIQSAAFTGAAPAAQSIEDGVAAPPGTSFVEAVKVRLSANASESLTRFFLQLLIVISVSLVVGWIFTRCGQPAVVGEMMAGVLLGPSLFGWIAPGAFQFIFAANSLEPLRMLSQMGVCLFMFAVGMEMDWTEMKKKAGVAILVSHASIALPAVLGTLLAFIFYDHLAEPGAPFVPFALFVAISMSITAFPVLVRILQDRKLLSTPLGGIASACAAVGDATAWALLAFVVAIGKSADFNSALFCLGLVALYVFIMFAVFEPNLPRWLGRAAVDAPRPSRNTLGLVIAFVLASAVATQLLGIRALFGSFVAGLVMPKGGEFRGKLRVRVENISSVLLLPVFFAFSGLRTEIGLLHTSFDWMLCLLIVVVASVGKLGGSFAAAHLSGLPPRQALQLGALMNTRGLMELIALNLGYELHLLSHRVFSMLVLMALLTTVMTGPLLTLFGAPNAARAKHS